MKRYLYNLLFTLFLTCQCILAQNYPVQVVPSVLQPYSSKMSDYANAMQNRVQLQLITTDVTVQNRAAQLEIKIQGNGLTAQSNVFLNGIRPFYINGGEILSLTSADLAGYFSFQNLIGLSSSQYSEPLPDGIYTICFRVYDAVTRNWLSQNTCVTMYLLLNDPPQLNLPVNFEQIQAKEFPNIIFSWSPRHLNATNVTYTFELKEILDPNLDPKFAFEISPILYKQDEMRITTLLYDISKPILIPGKKYAWRVKASSTTGLTENSVFKNNGYSEVYSFTYQSTCEPPTHLLSEQQGATRVKLMWQGLPSHQKYHIQYRKANAENATWYDETSLVEFVDLTNLEPNFTYEFRVGATCELTPYNNQQSYVYSNIQTFTLLDNVTETTYNCGFNPDIAITNQNGLENIQASEKFKAGDFTVKISEVTGSNGSFSGKGVIEVPYLKFVKINVEFTDIKINTDYQLVSGVVETAYDPDWKNVVFVDDLWDVNQNTIVLKHEITDPKTQIIINKDGTIVITYPDGSNPVTHPGGKNTVIIDSKGNTYYIDKQGEVSGPFKQAKGGKPTPENTDGVDKNGEAIAYTAQGVQVAFDASTAAYAYDDVAYNIELTKYHKKIADSFIPFKSVLNGKTDVIIAKITAAENVAVDSIFFKTQNGVEIPSKRIEGTNDFELVLTGTQDFAVEQVQATIVQDDKFKIAAAFNLVYLTKKDIKVVLVPTKNKLTVDFVANLKAIYSKVGIELDVTEDEVFNLNSFLTPEQITDTKNVAYDLSTYSSSQKLIFDQYAKAKGNIGKAYYIFLIGDEGENSTANQNGYMRLGAQFGLVYNVTALNIAHELGHGALYLEHPFTEFKSKNVNPGMLKSVMDYEPVNQFVFSDWKQINDPKIKIYAFQSQSDGEFSNYILTPDYQIVQISGTETILSTRDCNIFSNNQGVLHSFKLGDETYCWIESKSGNNKYYSGAKQLKNFNKVNQVSKDAIISLYFDLNEPCPKPSYKLDVRYSDISNILNANGINKFIESNRTNENIITVNCNTNSESYENLNQFGKLVYDENMKHIPEADYDLLLKISKIAQKFDVDVYSSFVNKQKNNGAMFWLGEVRDKPYTREKLEATYEHIANYFDALDKLYNYEFTYYQELISHIQDNFQVTKGSNHIFVFPSDPKFVQIITAPFKVMNVERKKQLLDILNKASYYKYQKIGDDIGAGRIIATLFSTTDFSSSEALSLFNYTIEKNYLKHFLDDLYGVDYDGFITAVSNIALYHTDYKDVHLDISNPNYIKFTDALLGAQNNEKVVSSNLIRFEVNKWSPRYTIIQGMDYYGEKYRVDAKPLDPVVVEFTKDIKLGKYQIKEGTKVPLPAIVVYDIFWQDTKAARWDSAQLTSDVVLTTLGVGEVIWAVRAFRTAQTARATFLGLKAAADMGVGFRDIYIQNIDAENLTEEQLNTWNKFVLLYSVGSFSTSAIEGVLKKYAKNAITNQQEFNEFNNAVKHNNIDLDLNLNNSSFKSQIDELVGNSLKWFDDLEILLGSGTKTKINNWISKGLSESKIEAAFASSTDKVGLLNKLDNSKSIYHQRVHIEDWDNIPGIMKSKYTPNGLKRGKTNVDWNNSELDLPSSEAANFVNAVAVELPAKTKIYRVTGGRAAGAYWTLQKPKSVGEVIGGTAVQPAWNDFSKMYVYEVPQGQTLKAWQGTTAKQPISKDVINPHLPGGEQQLFIPDVVRDDMFEKLVKPIALPW